MNEELRKIKKIYGEEMMHMCRIMFPTILEEEGLLLSILEANLAPTHSLAKDIIEKELYTEFENWINSFLNYNEEIFVKTNKTPFELMQEKGYTLYECHSETDIHKFKKYYAPQEVLCTFRGGRLNNNYVFFAVKEGAESLRREDFEKPDREDDYGRSVISIQFRKGKYNQLSIKNRYNHSVKNPDATFANNLEKINPGLTYSFISCYNLRLNPPNRHAEFLTQKLSYIQGKDGKYYRYNVGILDTYFCENNIIVLVANKIVKKYNQKRERYLLADEYIIDREGKRIFKYDEGSDSFLKTISDLGIISGIDVTNMETNKLITIHFESGASLKIGIDKHGSIIFYENNYVETIEASFLVYNTKLQVIRLQNVRRILPWFCYRNDCLTEIDVPKVKYIATGFLPKNTTLKTLSVPNLEILGGMFLAANPNISCAEILEQIRKRNIELLKKL